MESNNQVDQFQQEFEARLARFEEQKEKQAIEKLKRLDEEFPLRDRILALEQAKARDRIKNNITELEQEYGWVADAPQITFTLTDLLNKDFPPVEWLVEKLMPETGLIAISGLPGSYKSWVVQHLALSVATGTPLFDRFPTKQKKVLLIDKENQLSLIQKRFKLLGAFEGIDVHFISSDFLIEDEQIMNQICELIKTNGIGLIILDSLIRIYKGKDENRSNDMAEVFRQLRRFQEAGAAVIFVHHHRKMSLMAKNVAAESLRGSSDILAAVDSHLAMEVSDGEIKIIQTKLRQDVPIKPFKVVLESDDNHAEFKFLGELKEDIEKMEQAKGDIYEVLEEGEKSRSELVERFKGNYGSKTIDSALKSFTSEEVLVRIGERGKKFYRRADIEVEGSLFNPVSQNGTI